MRVAVSAMLLTFLTAISAGVLLYAYVTGIVGDVIANIPNVSPGQLVLDSVSVNDVSITVSVRNVGSEEAFIVNYVYVNEVPSVLSPSVEVLPSSTAIIRITGTYSSGSTYNVQLVCTNGYTVTFDVTY